MKKTRGEEDKGEEGERGEEEIREEEGREEEEIGGEEREEIVLHHEDHSFSTGKNLVFSQTLITSSSYYFSKFVAN